MARLITVLTIKTITFAQRCFYISLLIDHFGHTRKARKKWRYLYILVQQKILLPACVFAMRQHNRRI